MSIPENFVAQNLPVSLPEYEQVMQEQFRNVLRLYFNQLDKYNRVLNEQVATSQVITWLDM